MPDWTYQTVFRPLLRQLPYTAAQKIAFGVMGRLGRLPAGRTIIRLMGHARPTNEVRVTHGDLNFISPIVLGCGVDLSGQAVSALSLFGFGMIEVGPVGEETGFVATKWDEAGVLMPVGASCAVQDLCDALARNPVRGDVQVIARLVVESQDHGGLTSVIDKLRRFVDGFSFDVRTECSQEQFAALLMRDIGLSFLIVDSQQADDPQWDLPGELSFDGIIVESDRTDDLARGRLCADVVQKIEQVVARISGQREGLVIAAGGIRQPEDALRVLNAGADLVMVDSGFAEAGPGLPKRINSAVQAARLSVAADGDPDEIPAPQRSWFWSVLLGMSLFLGGVAAFFLGWTRVVLPYDEEFLGMLREEICGLNDRLLPFMSHDRVTLAGTMLALGPLYVSLGWFGERHGMHWARVAVLASSFVGFLSFFLFLGFGYFDPFHAFIAAVLFQFMLLGLRSSLPPVDVVEFDVQNSSAWRRAMWGQLLMVLHGGAVLVAGIVISSFGATTVFVAEDLEFMRTTREALLIANARLVPLVAHDRASFGGMLMSTGVCVLLTSLWGWQRGRRWLWWTLIGTGTTAYATTIAVHWWVGYTHLLHLLPAYGGLLFLWLAMLLSRQWMFEEATTRAAENGSG